MTVRRKGPSPGAGLIIVKSSKKIIKILALITHQGKYDLPKGALDSIDNSFLECAKRECEEECSVKVKNKDLLKHIPIISSGKLVLFVASTTQKPEIKRNPHTGILEHRDYAWVTTSDFKSNTLKYLEEAIKKFENYTFMI